MTHPDIVRTARPEDDGDRADEPDPDPHAAHALARYQAAQQAWLRSRAAFLDLEADAPAAPPAPAPLPPNALRHRPGWP